MELTFNRNQALDLLKKYNQEPFHIRHALTVEAVMKEFADELGYSEDRDYWGLVGLLHDVDFEKYPDQHCQKAVDILKEINASNEFINSVCSHGYGICSEVKPEHEMEKVLYACDELTGLINACALIRPSKSTKDMKLKSLKKKFKSLNFAAGCDREIIKNGAELLDWDLNNLLSSTLEHMKTTEDNINEELEKI